MQIRRTYKNLNPELLYDEVRDFILKQGAVIGESKMETYSVPGDSSTFVSRGTMTFKGGSDKGETEKECVRVHVVGSARDETKLMLDIDDKLFTKDKLSALQEDLDFIFGSYEVKRR